MLVPLSAAAPAEPPAIETRGAGIEVAIAPFLPPRALIGNYQPLRAYLQQALGEPVTIITAPDYQTFFERTGRREYTIAITLAHAAWLAQSGAGYVPLLRPVGLSFPVTVVARRARSGALEDLRGERVALPDPLAVISAQAMEMFRQRGFDPASDFRLQHHSTHSAAINHVLTGEVAAAVVSNRALQQMSVEAREAVRVIEAWEPGSVPGIFWLAHPALPRARAERIANAVLVYTESTVEGRALMQQWGYGGLVRATPDDVQALAPYGRWLREALARAAAARTEASATERGAGSGQ